MPVGDPAGYLPNVLRARKRRGQPAVQPHPYKRGSSAPEEHKPRRYRRRKDV